jgi:hypothetical protein
VGLDDALGVTDNDGVSVPDGLGSCDDVCERACVSLCDSEGLPDVVKLGDGDSVCELVETCEALCVPLVLAVAVIDGD